MRKLILLILLATSCCWGAACTTNANGNWDNKTTWGTGSGCVGASALCSDATSPCPGLGDTVTIGHAVVQNVSGLVIGVNGAAPAVSYLGTLGGLGGGSGYTGSCSLSVTGGTALGGRAGWGGCYIISGVPTAFIADRGSYSVCPTNVSITGLTGGSGATVSATPTCPTGGGTPAINISASDSHILTISADTYVRGTLQLNGDYSVWGNALYISPGANLFMDMTQASGVMYRIETSNDNRGLSADCTSAQCSIQGYGGVTSIDSQFSGGRDIYIAVKNVLFRNVGDTNTQAMHVGPNNSAMHVDVENSVFDTCGASSINNIYSGSTVIWSGNIHKNTPVRYPGEELTSNLMVSTVDGLTTGVRRVTDNAFDGSISNGIRDNGGIVGIGGFTLSGNVFGKGLVPASNDLWASFTDNFWRWANTDYVSEGLRMNIAGSIYNTYFLADSQSLATPHYLTGQPPNTAISNNIFTFNGRTTGQGKWLALGTDDATYTASNNIQPCGNPESNNNFSNPWNGAGYTMLYTHNTYCSNGPSMLYGNESAPNPAGFLTLKSNLLYTAPGKNVLIWETGSYGYPPTQDICTTTSATASNCDYNGAYLNPVPSPWVQSYCPGCTNQGRGYSGLWSYTPGYHDVEGANPQFVDTTRKVESFDRRYLGKSLESQWVGGTTYSYNSRVSNSDPNEYSGEVFNFRCINPAGCTSAEAPGTAYAGNYVTGSSTSMSISITSLNMFVVNAQDLDCGVPSTGNKTTVSSYSTTGTAPITSVTLNYASTAGVTCRVSAEWRANWEWASLYWLRELTYAKTAYTDGAIGCSGCSVVQALNAWVRAGFVTQNPRYWGAGHDGKDIGAVQLPAVRRMLAGAVVPLVQ